jgi:hypothetical protein
MMGYGLAILLGMASGIAGVRSRQGPRRAIRSLPPFIGPLLILIGTEIVPHVLSPCLVTETRICELTSEGADVRDRWHPLDHALVGALPMASLYWITLRRWRPDLLGEAKADDQHTAV